MGNRLCDDGSVGATLNIALIPLIQVPGRSEFHKNKKTEEETEMGPVTEESPSGSIPEARMSNFLKSLWFPGSTIPTWKSGQIVYGCAFLLGEQWDFSLVIF